jgi:hypothetical protein
VGNATRTSQSSGEHLHQRLVAAGFPGCDLVEMRAVRYLGWWLVRLEIASWAALLSAWLANQLAVLPRDAGALIGLVVLIATLHLMTRNHSLPRLRPGLPSRGTESAQAAR